MGFVLSAAEMAKGNAEYAKVQAEYTAARKAADSAVFDANEQDGTDQVLHRIANELSARAASLLTRLNSLGAFLQSAEVEEVRYTLAQRVRREDEPTPPTTPGGAAVRYIPVRGRTVYASFAGWCQLSATPIRRGDQITFWMGVWAHTSAVDKAMQDSAKFRIRQMDRQTAESVDWLVSLMPSVAA